MGRPSKRTPENARRIVSLLKKGLRRNRAYHGAGISADTFYEWLKDDPGFAQAVDEAESGFLAELEQNARKSARGGIVVHKERTTTYFADGAVKSVKETETQKPPSDPMLMFLLERRDPEGYGKRLDVTSNGQTVKAYVGFDPEEV